MSRQVVYRSTRVSFTVDGSPYDVSFATLGLAIGEIPTLQVGIAPEAATSDVEIHRLDLGSMKEAFQELSAAATRHAAVNFSAMLLPDDPDMPVQEMSVSGWMLASVGLEQITTTSNFSLVCTVRHPAYELALNVGCFFNGAGVIHLDEGEVEQIQNPIDAGVKALEATIEANKEKIETICMPVTTASTPLKDPNEIKDELSDGMERAKDMLGKLIAWDHGYVSAEQGIPYEDVGDPVDYGVKYAIATMWIPNTRNQSLFDLLRSNGAEFYYDIIPTYREDHLVATPSNPYGGPPVALPDEFTYSLDMPGFDPDPWYGVIMYQGQGTSDPAASVTFVDGATGASVIQPANMAFIPVASELSGGRLVSTSDPGWLETAMVAAASRSEVNPRAAGGDSFAEDTGENPQIDENIMESLDKWNQVRLRHLATLFMGGYRSQMSAAMRCAFCPVLPDGSEPIPGSVLSFSSGGELFTGKILTVTHEIDCQNSRGFTSMTLGWCDTDGGTTSVIGASPKVPAYNAEEVDIQDGDAGER